MCAICFILFFVNTTSGLFLINQSEGNSKYDLSVDLKIKKPGDSWQDDELNCEVGTNLEFKINCNTDFNYQAIAVKVQLPKIDKNPMFEYDWGPLGFGSSEPKPFFPIGDWSANDTDVIWAWYNIEDSSWSKEMTFNAKIVKSGSRSVNLRVIAVRDITGAYDEMQDSVTITGNAERTSNKITLIQALNSILSKFKN